MSPTPRTDAARAVAELGTIMGVWAHPDDEAYLSAGLMRLALENGQRVVCVTATKGELGTSDPFTWPPDRLAPARRLELAASFAAIADGLDNRIEHHWLDHRDGRCADIRSDVGATEVGELIDRIRPDTVVTFEPGGLTGHTDHQAIAEWATLAVADRADIRQLDAVIAQSFLDHFDGRLDLEPFFYDGFPRSVEDATVCLHLVLPDDLWEIKDHALRAQATQTDVVIDMLGLDLWKEFNLVEAFVEHSHDRTPPVGEPEHTVSARNVYDHSANHFVADVGTRISTEFEAPLDRAVLHAFAEAASTREPALVLDVGCGTGRVAGFLAERGLDVSGVDISEQMVGAARLAHPDIAFDTGSLTALPVADSTITAAAYWYSIIATPPTELAAAWKELDRVLTDDGHVLVAFQAGHSDAIVRTDAYGSSSTLTLYHHSVLHVTESLGDAGFEVTADVLRQPAFDHETTPQAILLARRRTVKRPT
ncbi:MAG: bifunctional PIG-L family deacetylase/class I SAM-dependent methyltransferase [Ilumatobacter sp.]|uniref:PIG-L family deacetylase n=1 Tax=Ilumatobacter sp. TaxID=1967498 RepID=UPI003C74B1A8